MHLAEGRCYTQQPFGMTMLQHHPCICTLPSRLTGDASCVPLDVEGVVRAQTSSSCYVVALASTAADHSMRDSLTSFQ